MRSTEHLCPRRRENPIANQIVPGFDTWDARDGYRCCSYCGSMHPEDVFMAIADGVELIPTDKNYKLYVMVPHPRAGETIQIGSESGPARNMVTSEPSRDDLTLWERITGRYNRKIMGTASATLQAKFYFQHFDQEQQERFINLLNVKAVTWGYPGHLYVLPFFAARGA
jgi:hypothetical protein